MAHRTVQHKKAMLKALEESLGVVTVVCRATKIARVTFYDWYNNDPEFKKAVDELGEVALDFAEERLHGQIQKGDTTACIFYLKTKGKKRGYIERTEIDANVDMKIEGELAVKIDKIYGK